jgi:1-acyl-sn-glycerol-3-phosphate acyltransferase
MTTLSQKADRALAGPVAFGLLVTPVCLGIYAACKANHLLGSKKGAQERSLASMRFLLRTLLRSCFWLKVNEPTTEEWDALHIPTATGCLVMFNHTSLFDGFLNAAVMPRSLCVRCKSLMASYTFKTPVLGAIFRLVGHEPVYFLKDDEGKFSVDKAKQAPVNERVRAHVAQGGVLAFCPEGTVNKHDPTKCLPLRRGSFQLAIDLRVPIYGISSLGQHRFWPHKGAPGHSAHVNVSLYEVKAWNDRVAAGTNAGLTATDLATMAQEAMQASVDALSALPPAGDALPGRKGR